MVISPGTIAPFFVLLEVIFVRNLPKLYPLLTLAVLMSVAGATFVQAQPTVRDHEIVPEDYFDLITLGNLQVSPDGDLIAYTESRWGQGKEGRGSDLWLVDKDGKAPRRLTFDNLGGSGVCWAPDGTTLYFVARRDDGRSEPPFDGSRQVWSIAPDGTNLHPVTRIDDGVGDFLLSPDGAALYYTVSEESVDEPWQDLKEKYSDLEYGHGVTHFDAVRKLDLRTWRDSEVLPADRVIWEMDLSSDGRRLAMITTEDNELIFKEGRSRVEVADLGSGDIDLVTPMTWRADHPSPYGWIDDVTWTDDGRALAFSISYDGYASRIWVAEEQDDGWSLSKVSRPDMVTYDGGLTWRGDDRTLCYRGESLGRVRVYGTEKVKAGGQGRTKVLTEGDVVVQAFAFDGKGKKLAAVVETITHTNDVFLYRSADKASRLTNVNPQVDTWKLPQIEHVQWTGADGDACYGILELPPDYQPGDGPLPTVIELHGGPTSSTKYRLRLWIYGRALMASNGYALLSPNYHGSTGYGDAFLEKLIGRENEIEVTDILTGIEHLVAEGITDRDHIGVMGWSNGGYLTNCMITAAPDLFKAASSGAGVLDMVIQWGTEDTPGHVINFVEGLPWETPNHYRTASPLYDLDKVKTPTLIHVGGSDPRVPPAHSRALYRALRHYLDVPVELVVYPGEPHGLTTHENRLAKMKWDLAWFKKYLRE